MKVSSNDTPSEVINKQVVMQNVAQWRRHRRNRSEAIVKRENNRRFNSIADRMPHWEAK